MLDELVLTIKSIAAGTYGQPPVDQNTIYYQNRTPGPDYIPPFPIGNPNYCQGEASDIAFDGNAIDMTFYLITMQKFKPETDEMRGDQSAFAVHDL